MAIKFGLALSKIGVLLLLFYFYFFDLLNYVGKISLILLAVGLFVLELASRRSGWQREEFRIFLLYGLFAAQLLLSVLFSKQAEYSTVEALQTVILLLCGTLVFYCDGWQEICLKLILFFSLYYALTVWLQLLVPDFFHYRLMTLFPEPFPSRSLGFYLKGFYCGATVQVAKSSIYMVTGICAALALLLEQKKARYGFYLFFMFVPLLLSGKRATSIFLVVTVLAVYYMYCKARSANFLLRLILAGGAAATLLPVLFVAVPQTLTPILKFFWRIKDGDVTSGRIDIFGEALNRFFSHPLGGIGFDSYLFETGIKVHNSYLQILCEIGFLGMVVYLILLGSNFALLYRSITERPNGGANDLTFQLFAFGFQCFFLLYSLTENAFGDRYILLMYLLAAAVHRRKEAAFSPGVRCVSGNLIN